MFYNIGLDPPVILTLWRVLVRTFGRIFLGEPTCADGCRENIAMTLGSRKSILVWCLSQHSIVRGDYVAKWEGESAEQGRGKWRRFEGWGSSLKKWLGWLNSSIRSEWPAIEMFDSHVLNLYLLYLLCQQRCLLLRGTTLSRHIINTFRTQKQFFKDDGKVAQS